ncbi:MAG: hypothetical protein ACOYL5_06365 [Phototrophicaceae bacterium]
MRIFSIPVDQDALLLAIKHGRPEVHTAWHDVGQASNCRGRPVSPTQKNEKRQ